MEAFGILMERFLSRFAYYDSTGNRYSNKAKRIAYNVFNLSLVAAFLASIPDSVPSATAIRACIIL